MRSHWVLCLATMALTTTTGTAAAVLAHGRASAGMPADWPGLLLWQGLVFGSWVPIGWGLSRLTARVGFKVRLVAVLYGLGVPVAGVHAALAATLDVIFSPRMQGADWGRLVLARAPVDMLVYVALATFAAALHGQRLATEAAARAAELAGALESARRALEQPPAAEAPARLLVSVGSRQAVVDPGEVEWFASAGNYVVVNWNGRDGLIRETLTALERRLDPAVFARAHRSTLVNLARVQEAAPLADGSWRLTTESGGELVVSRSFRDAVLARLRGG